MEAKGLKVLGIHWSADEWRRGNFHAAWIKHIVSITVFICSSLQNQTSEVLRNSLGRFSFVICLIACSCWLLLMIKAFWRTRHHGWRRFIHHLCLILLIIAPIALMVLTIMGYYLTAIQLAFKLLLQVAIILLLIIVSSIILEIIRFQALQAEVAKENWITFNKLVKAVSLILILGSCLFIWNDVLPALNVINSITLWTIKIETGVQNISLGDAMLAVIIAFITILITRNMPMLLTLVKFDKLPWDTGLRNAVATLVRYSIIIIGFGSALSVLGLSWSDIQWLVAAVSVGLGFGLQEIFANFISGIIILFERPVRPGDTVTIGDVSGEVTKINIRATTIKDWDNREMIVPNKEFITGHILNWTGSDKIQRAVITIGVAYGSDTQLVQDILLKVAADNPYVLKEPQPSVVFNEFADSSLNFNLRAYVDIDNLTTAKHTLRLAINKEFSAAGIEIAFPQLDVHICNNEATAAKN